jgi:hypothetical protein
MSKACIRSEGVVHHRWLIAPCRLPSPGLIVTVMEPMDNPHPVPHPHPPEQREAAPAPAQNPADHELVDVAKNPSADDEPESDTLQEGRQDWDDDGDSAISSVSYGYV